MEKIQTDGRKEAVNCRLKPRNQKVEIRNGSRGLTLGSQSSFLPSPVFFFKARHTFLYYFFIGGRALTKKNTFLFHHSPIFLFLFLDCGAVEGIEKQVYVLPSSSSQISFVLFLFGLAAGKVRTTHGHGHQTSLKRGARKRRSVSGMEEEIVCNRW